MIAAFHVKSQPQKLPAAGKFVSAWNFKQINSRTKHLCGKIMTKVELHPGWSLRDNTTPQSAPWQGGLPP